MSVTTTLSPIESLKNEIESLGYVDTQSAEFYQELMDYGIETVSQFEDAYQGQYLDGASFAESLCEDCGYLPDDIEVPTFITNHIDWEAVWSRELRFDYFEVDGHFFTNNF
tara:strand:+ start:151 stop:483 length:333 start_codon:yes stop_codon:yes gene_type:complete